METKESNINRLVIIGLSGLNTSDGSFRVRDPIADYLHEQSTYFDDVILVGYKTDSDRCTTPLDTDQVTPFLLEPQNPLKFLKQSSDIAAVINNETAILVQAPYTLALPLLPIIRIKAHTVVGYMASKPEDIAKHRQSNDGLISSIKSTLINLNGSLIYRFSDRLLVRGHEREYQRKHPDVIPSKPIVRLPDVKIDQTTVPDTFNILYVGSLQERKGVDILIKAVDYLLEATDFEAELVIVGKGDQRQKLQGLVSDLERESQITFYGWIDDMETIAQFYKGADILVVPSRTAEGSPRVIDEGHYYGIPIVASDLSYDANLKDGENVLFFEPGSIDGLFNALKSVLEQRNLRMKLIQSGKERINQIKKETAAKQHATVVHEHSQQPQ